jgi:hypothetical protein
MSEWKSLLDSAIERSGDPNVNRAELAKQRPDNAKVTLILEGLKTSNGKYLPFEKLYPDGVPTDGAFFDRLFRLKVALGFGQVESEITAIMGSASLEKLAEEDRCLILLGIADENPVHLGLRLEILPQLLRDHSWPLALVSKVLLSANDKPYQGEGGYDRAVRNIAEYKPSFAYDLVGNFIKAAPTEKSLGLAQYLLGLLRLRTGAVEVQQKIKQLDNELRTSVHLRHRIVYLRSQVPTAWSRGLTASVLEYLQFVYRSGESEEQIVAFEVLTHLAWCPANQETVFQTILAWLEEVINEKLPERCKTAVIVLIHNASFWAKGFIEANLERLALLWLRILPVDSGNDKYWNGVDLALHDLIEKNASAFETVFTRLAEVEGAKLINAIADNEARQNRMLIFSLQQKTNLALVHDLLFSEHRRARRVGIFLYDELNVAIIDKSRLNSEREDRLLLLLLELRLHYVSGLGQARLLVSLASQADRCSAEFRQELLDDLILLGKDLPGTVLDFFKATADSLPLLKDALVQIDTYFDNLRASDKCPALRMSIPGYSRAVHLFAKRFSRQVTEATERNSIFAMITSKMILLYGLNHSSYRAGVLSKAEALQNISHSQEYPRIGVIAPESQAYRRLIAKQLIEQIERGSFNE